MKILPTRLLTAFVFSLSLLGVSAKTPLPLPPVEAAEAFSAVPSVGYDTFYIFRGEQLFEQVAWGQIELSLALGESLSLTLTPWYLVALEDDYTELDILPSLTWDAGVVQLTAGYAGYFFPRGAFGGTEGIGDEHEANFMVSKTIGLVDASTMIVYNFNRDGFYFEGKLGTSVALGEAVSLDPSVTVGYGANYFAQDGFTHALLTLAMPVTLSETVLVTPYLAGNIPLAAFDENQQPELFGGIALAVSF